MGSLAGELTAQRGLQVDMESWSPRSPGLEGYESPDDDYRGMRAPQRMRSSPAVIPHRRRREEVDLTERGAPEMERVGLNDSAVEAKRMRRVGVRDRIACVRWTWFTMTMVGPGLMLFGELGLTRHRLREALRMSLRAVCSPPDFRCVLS